MVRFRWPMMGKSTSRSPWTIQMGGWQIKLERGHWSLLECEGPLDH